jgi:hypothetical protein
MDVRRENRVLRIAVVVLFCALAADVAVSEPGRRGPDEGGPQNQRLPGPGSGVVDVTVSNTPAVAQHGEWRVAQQGDWRVGVQGTVATLPAMPPHLKAGGRYLVRWSGGDAYEEITVEELHPSGWARIGRARWVNLAQAATLEAK